jgi:hypothetical protein
LRKETALLPAIAAGSILLGLPALACASDVPANLVLDVRLLEARSTQPNFQVMENLSFFVNTDGTGVSESQWLATIARQVPESMLATLATDRVEPDGLLARFELDKRSRAFVLDVNLGKYLDQGTFKAATKIGLRRGDERLREFDREVELRLGQTYVWSGRELELSASEYVSHFRDFDDNDHRGKLYERLRGFTLFMVVAVTPRLIDTAPGEVVDVSLPQDLLPKLESPLQIPLVGEIVLDLVLDGAGAATEIAIMRSSIPEVNPRILGEASQWTFPEASGKRARLTLKLRAEP